MTSSASYNTLCFLILILTLISTFGLSSSQDIEVVSGDDNVGSVMGSAILTSFRFLLGLHSSKTKRPVHLFSPAPAPMEEEEEDPSSAPAPTPALRTRIYSAFPHKLHNQPAHKLEDEEDHRAKSRLHAIVIAVAASIGSILVVIFSVAAFLVCKWSRRRRIQSSSSRNKVSYDPGPELFYLNSLAPILDVESSFKNPSQSKNVLSSENLSSCNQSHDGEPRKSESEPMSCRDEEILSRNSLSPFLGTKSSPIRSYEPKDDLQNEAMKCDSDNLSCLDEEIIQVENLSSDDESFHSVCNSHSSVEVASVVSESNLSCASGHCSPYRSSTGSSSPHCKITYFPSKTKHSFSPSQMFINKTSHSQVSSHINNSKSLQSSQCLPSPCIQETEQASKPEMISSPSKVKCTSQIAMTSLAPKSTALASPPQPPPLASVVSNGNVITRPPPPPMPSISNGNIPKPPPPPMPSISNGNVPRPPPPPLPPFRPLSSQNGCNSSHPPPPLPCQLQQGTPVGKDGTPLPKLKPLHWDKVRAAPDRSMVWDKIRSSSFELDEQMIESLFGYNTLSSVKNEEAKAKNSSPGKHVLDNKRLQNITILLKTLNATSAQVCEALIQGRGLSSQQLEALVKMAPTKEEEEKLSNYQGDIDELGSAEKFVKAILNIPFAFSRIQVMLYKETLEDEVIHLKKSFAMLEEACKELRSSRLFFRLLEAVLKTGNRMNVGTTRGGAIAFKLDTLLKLADVKGTDGKTTLLHFVVQEIIRSEGVTAMEKSTKKNKPKTAEEREEGYRVMGLDIVSGLSTELCNVKKTASIDLDVLASSVSTLTEGMKHLKNLIEVDLSSDERNGSFVNSMKSFQIDAERTIKGLKDDEDQVLVHVREITEYYHGNVSKVDEANPLRIFVIVRDFLGMLDRVCKEVRSLKAYHGPNPAIPLR